MADLDQAATVINNGKSFFLRFRPDGVITFVNKTSCQYFGKPAEELIGKNFKSFCLPESYPSIDQFLSSFTIKDHLKITELSLRLPDDRIRWLEWASHAIFDKQRHLVGFYSTGYDITERKEKEFQCQEKEKSFSQLVELSPMAICVHNGEKIRFLNKAALDLIGALSVEEVLGRNILDFVHPSYREAVRERTRRVLEKGEKTPLEEISLIKVSGEIIDVETITGPIPFAGEKCVQVLARDITRYKEMMKDLKEKNIALHQLVKQFELEKTDLKENMIANISHVIMPILEKSRSKGISGRNVKLVIGHFDQITSSYGGKIISKDYHLTAREIEICNILKHGHSNKEISDILHISAVTVERHRNNIRRKLGLVNQGVNLSGFLQSL